MNNKISAVRQAVRESAPLIHCITNPISIHQCANTVLAVGARPMMAEHPAEVAEITATAGALMLNIGNITDVRMESMKIAARRAELDKIPVLLDIVGISCSALRRRFITELLAHAHVNLIKGNYSEVYSLYRESYRSSGVDAGSDITEDMIIDSIKELSHGMQAVIMASGKRDIVSDGERILIMDNGSPQLATVTGTGCMLGALCASYMSVGSGMDAAAAACAVLGIAGEMAETPLGGGTFMVNLIDQLTTLSDETAAQMIRFEEV